jgi:5-methylcytosine-specific restriction endonuclease McrA
MRRSGFPARRSPIRRRRVNPTARAAVLARDGRCMFAEATLDAGPCAGPLHVHHVRPRSRGGGDEPANLVSLCGQHHAWVHAHPAAARQAGLTR